MPETAITLYAHTKANGDPCRSAALRDQTFCHFHRTLTEGHASVLAHGAGDDIACLTNPHNTTHMRKLTPWYEDFYSSTPPNQPLQLNFPPLEDRESIQVALSMLLNALGHNRLHAKRAAVILYGLQIAAANADRLHRAGDSAVSPR